MWVCPSYNRIHRLAHLAISWQAMEKGKELVVLVWKDDPVRDEYFSISWPKGWRVVECEQKMLGPRLDDWYRANSGGKFFGFIADDIVLRTRRGLEKLESLAEDWYIAYPSDAAHRNFLCTHFCVGGELARTIGGFPVPGFQHNWLDAALYQIGVSTGSLRFAADVIFDHLHAMFGKAEMDDTYRELADTDYENPTNPVLKADLAHFKHLQESGILDGICKEIIRKRTQQYEHPQAWALQDARWAGVAA